MFSICNMKFEEISVKELERIEKIYSSYEKTFPVDERRNRDQFTSLFSTKTVKVIAIVDNSEFCGYLFLWMLDKFTFLEHFEVFEEFRNKKLGSKILDKLKQDYSPIVLESEPSHESLIAERRIGFYERNGFAIIDPSYIQPSYEEGKNELPLFLMSTLPDLDVKDAVQQIYSVVYKKG